MRNFRPLALGLCLGASAVLIVASSSVYTTYGTGNGTAQAFVQLCPKSDGTQNAVPCPTGGGGSGGDASVGTINATAPTSGQQVAFPNSSGNLVSPTLTVDGAVPIGTTAVSSANNLAGTFTGTGASAPFTPDVARNGGTFNVAVYGSSSQSPGAALGGTVYLARSINGSPYLPVTANGSQLESFTTVASEQWSEPGSQNGTTKTVSYELICSSYSTGTITYGISQ
jgi:hypothetical protein